MEEFKATLYIQLLAKGNATTEEFENALTDFSKRVYNFCMEEKDVSFIVSDCSTTSCVFDFLLRCTPL